MRVSCSPRVGDELHVGGGHCLEVGRVVPDGGDGDQVGHRYGNPFVWHAEVGVDDALQLSGGRCGVEPGSCGVLGSPVDDVEAAPQAGSGEVAGDGRELSPARVAGDDVVDVVDMRGVVRGASGFQDAQAEVVVDPAVGEQENVLAWCCGAGRVKV